jgi:hypothetical protein
MMPSPRPRSTRQAQARLTYAVPYVARANLAVIAYRWRYELVPVAGLAAAWAESGAPGCAALAAGGAVLIGLIASTPPGRRFLLARMWCIITAHRVRVGCLQAWIHSRSGKIPVVLMTRSRPFGERLYLWCRAGTSAYDLSSARDLLAAACWAQSVEVARHPHYAHLVVLDVVRRGAWAAGLQPPPADPDAGRIWAPEPWPQEQAVEGAAVSAERV